MIASLTASLTITAPLHCLNAHITINSGARIEKNMRKMRRPIIVHFPSPLNGIFGCTDTHVHANVVARQLHNISRTVRPWHPSDGSSRATIGASNTADIGTGA